MDNFIYLYPPEVYHFLFYTHIVKERRRKNNVNMTIKNRCIEVIYKKDGGY